LALGAESCQFDIDEIEAELWCKLCEDEYQRLRAYDPGRGSLAAFLAVLSGEQIRRYRQKQQRRKLKEISLEEHPAAEPAEVDYYVSLETEEFRHEMSPQEALYFCTHEERLPAPDESSRFSPVNARQTRCHIIRRWKDSHRPE
jgi:hypothetical protein